MNDHFEVSEIEKRLFSYAALNRQPIYGGFELTPYCNFSCKMCYVFETQKNLPLLTGEQWLEFGKQAADAGTMCIVLSGGEPLLHPDFKIIYKGLKKLGMILTINTNGSLINEDIADFLASDVPRRVNLSFYGPNEDIYEKLCGNPSGFNKAIRAIKLMKERNIPVKINIVPNKINYPYLDEMLDICKKHDLTVEMTTYLFEPIRKSEAGQQLYRLSPQQMAKANLKWDHYRYNRDEMIARAIMCHQGLETFDASLQTQETTSLRCRAGSSSFWLCWNGKMNPCVNMLHPEADVKELGFAKAWEIVKEEGNKIKVPAKCNTCSLRMFCHNCAAIGYHQNGTFENIPEIMCQATEHYAKLLAQTVEKIEKH